MQKKLTKKSAREYAIYLLSKRERSESEIRRKLLEKDFPKIEIDPVIVWLKEKNFINDRRFTELYVRNKVIIGATGKYKIKQKLLISGIDKDIIEEELGKIQTDTYTANANDLAQKWLRKNQGIDQRKIYEKLGRHLIGKGFEIDVVKKILNETLET